MRSGSTAKGTKFKKNRPRFAGNCKKIQIQKNKKTNDQITQIIKLSSDLSGTNCAYVDVVDLDILVAAMAAEESDDPDARGVLMV